MKGGKEADKKSKKKRKRANEAGAEESETSVVLALGLSKGSVLLYSPAEAAVVGSLDGGHVGEVTDFRFVDGGKGSRGWSCGTDGKVVEWDLNSKAAIRYTCYPIYYPGWNFV